MENIVHNERSRAERQVLGRFDTPRPLAQALADWGIRSGSDRVLEPSFGGGVILRSILARLSEFKNGTGKGQVFGCDIDPRALVETRGSIPRDSVSLEVANFLDLRAQDFNHAGFDVVLGNPPFVRLHTMDLKSRSAARNCLGDGVLLGAKAGLWAYFPIHSHKFLRKGGRMGWILPESLLHAEYGKDLLNWARRSFGRCTVVSLRERCFTGDGAMERVVILLLENAAEGSSSEIELIEFQTAKECISALPFIGVRPCGIRGQLNGHTVPHLVSNHATDISKALENSDDLKPFGSFASIRIGVVTGDNDYFVLTDELREKFKIRRTHCRELVSKFSELGHGIVFGGCPPGEKRKWLLAPSPNSRDRALHRYLAQYSAAEIEKNKTMAKRSHWHIPVLGEVPDAFLRYMGQSAPRLILNRSNFLCTNTIHRIFFNKGTATETIRALSLSIHSSYTQLSAEFEGRQYGSGVLKLEPSEAKKVRIAFSPTISKRLAEAWPSLSKKAATDGWETIVDEVDRIILDCSSMLRKAIPLSEAKTLLTDVRRRREGRKV